MDGYWVAFVLFAMFFIPFSLYWIGSMNREHFYNYNRGKLDGRGMGGTKVENEAGLRLGLLVAWVFLPIGIWYLFGWHLTGNRGYDLGYKVGIGDRPYMEMVASDLFAQWYRID